MFDREIKLIEKDKLDIIQSKTVAIIGLGGVGGYALEALIRAGIINIIIVDYDKIDISNLNRQIITNQKNIGKYKIDEAEKRIKLINPSCNITKIQTKLTENNLDLIFSKKLDYIIDACDTVKVKEKLITEAIKKNVKLISSMGTGNKLNPELLRITDIRKTSYDPLAKRIRKFVKDNNIKEKVIVVSSTEIPKKVVGNISSISYVPSTAGLLCASYVINDIINTK